MEIKKFYEDAPIGICVVKRDRLNMRVVYTNRPLAHMLQPRVPTGGKKKVIHPADLQGKAVFWLLDILCILGYLNRD